jgi:hypothetical protein
MRWNSCGGVNRGSEGEYGWMVLLNELVIVTLTLWSCGVSLKVHGLLKIEDSL